MSKVWGIFKEGELERELVCAFFALTTQHGTIKGKTQIKFPKIEVTTFTKSHDRFLIIDGVTVYHIGASLKDLGKRWFAFSKIEMEALEILNKL